MPKERRTMSWTEVKYSRNQINKAGKRVTNPDISKEAEREAKAIINNWRSAHGYPLYVVSNKLKRMTIDMGNTFVVNRLKRYDSITAKLRRFPQMSLYGMQDISGCRVVTKDIKSVYAIAEAYENSRIRHVLHNQKDYIENPKSSGYRGVHRIYKYVSDKESKYNNMYVEIQFRTQLQHLWATAVEAMGVYTNANLKAGVGKEQYLRFFVLVSSLFALKERTTVVPNTSEDRDTLINEIREIDNAYHILDTLKIIRIAVNKAERNTETSKGHFLLILNYAEKDLDISYYKVSEFEKANQDYAQLEDDNNKDIDAVLVSANSFGLLKSAYPNYFGDVRRFVNLVQKEIR